MSKYISLEDLKVERELFAILEANPNIKRITAYQDNDGKKRMEIAFSEILDENLRFAIEELEK